VHSKLFRPLHLSQYSKTSEKRQVHKSMGNSSHSSSYGPAQFQRRYFDMKFIAAKERISFYDKKLPQLRRKGGVGSELSDTSRWSHKGHMKQKS